MSARGVKTYVVPVQFHGRRHLDAFVRGNVIYFDLEPFGTTGDGYTSMKREGGEWYILHGDSTHREWLQVLPNSDEADLANQAMDQVSRAIMEDSFLDPVSTARVAAATVSSAFETYAASAEVSTAVAATPTKSRSSAIAAKAREHQRSTSRR